VSYYNCGDVTDRLDNLELADDGLKSQLAQRLRIEESLKREANRSRVECERLQLELKSTQSELQQHRIKMTQVAAKMEKVRTQLILVACNNK